MDTNTQVNWEDLGLSPEMLEVIKNAGYKHPSPVQSQSIPHALTGADVLVSSQTGSGKTASFVIPAIERFKNKNGTFILALAPTREIANQTGEVFKTFGEPFGLKVAVCIGGASIPEEKEALSKSPHIIVATPGRLCDHLERGNIWLDFIQLLIFDEADRMLEMGFAKQIDMITEQIPKERQTLMLSATFASAVEKLARKAMKEPKMVTIEKTAESTPKIDQRLYWVEEGQKPSQLMRILREEKGTVFVFVKAKERAYSVWRILANKGFNDATYIHSDLPQDAREQAVADFKAGKYRVIVATDVMGRGIDVDDVAHVVNYDVPREPEDYIHRIGRTGRRGLTGMASTFAMPGKDDRAIKAIAKLRGVTAPERESEAPQDNRDARPRPEGQRGDRPSRGGHPSGGRPSGPRPEGERSRSSGGRPGGDRPRSEGQRDQRPRQELAPRERGPREPRPQTPVASPVAEAPKQKTSFIKKILGFFGGKG